MNKELYWVLNYMLYSSLLLFCIIFIPLSNYSYGDKLESDRLRNNISKKEQDMRLDENSWLFKKPIAHRGFHNPNAPENSLKAYMNAIKMDYAIELDIHMISDGNLIVFHDDNVERVTGVNMDVAELTIDDINELRLFNTSERIPLFKELLELVDGQVPLVIEIKDTSEVGVIEESLLSHLEGYNGDYVVQAFNPLRVKWLKNNAPHIIRGQLSGLYTDSDIGFFEKFVLGNLTFNFITKPDFINYEIAGLEKPIVKLLKFMGYPVISWTATDSETYCKALRLSENVVFERVNPEDGCK